jgi:hypothetical protein
MRELGCVRRASTIPSGKCFVRAAGSWPRPRHGIPGQLHRSHSRIREKGPRVRTSSNSKACIARESGEGERRNWLCGKHLRGDR